MKRVKEVFEKVYTIYKSLFLKTLLKKTKYLMLINDTMFITKVCLIKYKPPDSYYAIIK